MNVRALTPHSLSRLFSEELSPSHGTALYKLLVFILVPFPGISLSLVFPHWLSLALSLVLGREGEQGRGQEGRGGMGEEAKKRKKTIGKLYKQVMDYCVQLGKVEGEMEVGDVEMKMNLEKGVGQKSMCTRVVLNSLEKFALNGNVSNDQSEEKEQLEDDGGDEMFDRLDLNVQMDTMQLKFKSAFQRVVSVPKMGVNQPIAISASLPRIVPLMKDEMVPAYRKLSYTAAQPAIKSSGAFRYQAAAMNTLGLLHTYRVINQKYYQSMNEEIKTEEPKAIVCGDTLNGRYRVVKQLGSGAFGVVFEACDLTTNQHVALKVLKTISFANEECNIVSFLNRADASQQFGIVRLLDFFQNEKRAVLVFELMSLSLYDIIRNTSYLGCSLHLVKKFGRQLLQTLFFLQNLPRGADGCTGVIHCDLKPENILLCNKKKAQIKLIDFGSACRNTNSRMYSYIQSRFYRAPEVILGLPYSHPIDIWSLACVLVELHTGRPLFDGQTEADQVVKHVGTLGVPPSYMIESSDRGLMYFKKFSDGYALLPPKNYGASVSLQYTPLHLILGINSGGPGGRRANEKSGHSRVDYHSFYDVILRMLDLDPTTRLTAAEALSHPFFTETEASLLDEPTAAETNAAAASKLVEISQDAMETEPVEENKFDTAIINMESKSPIDSITSKLGRRVSQPIQARANIARSNVKNLISLQSSRIIGRRAYSPK